MTDLHEATDAGQEMRKALAVIAYTRSEYFEPVLNSILSQTIDGRPVSETYDIFLFQDGLWEQEGEASRMGHARIAEVMAEQGPAIQVIHQPTNLSVAQHFDFIERKLFVEHRYDVVVFCEDDMILAPGYMSAMDMMAERFHDDARVGMFSANPGNATRSLEDQRANRHRYCLMQHNWGFGVSRNFWTRRQKFVDLYLKWGESFEYRQRPSRDIFLWLESAGFLARSSSQDYVKSCATAALGAVKLATYVNYGLPIGEVGLHSTAAHYKKLGFDQTVVFDELPVGASELGDSQFQDLRRDYAAEHIKNAAEFDREGWLSSLEHEQFAPDPFIARVLRERDALARASEADVAACYKLFLGRLPENERVVNSRVGLAPQKVLESFLISDEFSHKTQFAPLFAKASEALQRRCGSKSEAVSAPLASVRIWSVNDISAQPHMEPQGITLLKEHLYSARIYLEYGAGGSTMLAAESGVREIHTVESDSGFLAAVKDRVDHLGLPVHLQLHHVDIGPTGDWGVPTDRARASKWPNYCSLPWRRLGHRNKEIDLILIDGRFRVACFLLSLLNARAGTTILFDDYADRQHYHVVEKHLRPVLFAGRMAKFVVERDRDLVSIATDALEYCTEQA